MDECCSGRFVGTARGLRQAAPLWLLIILNMLKMSINWINCLIFYAGCPILVAMRRSGKRSEAGGSQFVAQPSELGALLTDLRTAKGLSLREVEEATGRAVSNAYLSQLEHGKIKKPSPNVLHSLSGVYAVPYEALMEKAGYLMPSENAGGRRTRLTAFAIDDLTAEEEEELLKYLAFLRSRKPS
jgi:transcriptional regulator with XRE-family HTH domain